MNKTPYVAALAAIALAGFSGADFPFAAVPAFAQAAASKAEQAAKAFDPAKNLDLSGAKIAYKRLPAGVKAKIVGTTYEQLVDFDGTIRNPISPKTTVLTFELTDRDGNTAQTAAFEVAVPVDEDFAKARKNAKNPNAKPAVVPALQEWFGGDGKFVPSADFAVVVPAKCAKLGEPTLRERAELFARELSEIFGREVKVVDKQREGKKDIVLAVVKPNSKALSGKTAPGKESYGIFAASDGLYVYALDPLGAFWGTRTILQVFKQNDNAFPCGIAVDYPQYPLRGFSYDVGRKPASLKALKDAMKTMSYYKMNDFQVHLNDNFIWLHDYTKIPNGRDASEADKKAAIAEVLAAEPTAFRLESDMVGKNGHPLTAKDHFYTKKEFGDFIDEAKLYGVTVVPELDVPGHAMSFVLVRPDLMYRGKLTKPYDAERAAMLDLSADVFDPKTGKTYREETLDFVQSVFDEYLVGENGEEPVFRTPVIHIGTDEYYGNAEDYRAFADAMLKYVKERGYTPRLWGSLSAKKGKTPVDGTGSQIDVWSLGWQNPHLALEHDFDIINIVDVTSYIVPSGTGSVGGYGDLLNLPFLYSEAWQPHLMGKPPVVPGMPKLLGAQWALWNDNSFRRDTGLTDYDLFARIRDNCAVFAEKTWNNAEDRNYREFMSLVKTVDYPPFTNPEYVVKAPDGSDVLFELKKAVPAGTTVETGIAGVAPDYVAEFRVKLAAGGAQPQVLASGPTGQLVAAQKGTGKLGIVRDTWDYSFDYALPVGREVTLKLVAKKRTLTLFADGKEIGAPKRHAFPETHKFSTFVFPLETLGSKDSCADLVSLKITRLIEPGTENAVPPSEFRSLKASSEHGRGADGDVYALADGDVDTYWHSRYAPKEDKPPFEIVVELKKPEELAAFAFLPRQNGDNGNVKSADLFLRDKKGAWKKVGSFRGNGVSRELQKITFPKQKTDALKLVVRDGVGGFGTIAEIYPIRAK